jgi:hypothetical protein
VAPILDGLGTVHGFPIAQKNAVPERESEPECRRDRWIDMRLELSVDSSKTSVRDFALAIPRLDEVVPDIKHRGMHI